MFRPSAAPRWKSTISFFLLGMGVAATARCRNAGMVLMPIMATPPLFTNTRLETFMAYSLADFISVSVVVARLFRGEGFCFRLRKSPRPKTRFTNPSNYAYRLASLKFRRAQNQPRNHGCVHFLHRIVQTGLQNLRIGQLRFECFAGLG